MGDDEPSTSESASRRSDRRSSSQQPLPKYIPSQVRKELTDGEFIDTCHPEKACSPVLRSSLTLKPLGCDAFEPIFDKDEAEKCIICHEIGTEPLIGCERQKTDGRNRKAACISRFHKECIIKYNHGSFMFQYAALPECQDRLLCPLHCCHVCNDSRYKQSAYTGELIECSQCYRSFHLNTCIPSGAKQLAVKRKGEKASKMIICPLHFPKTSSSSTKANKEIVECYKCGVKQNGYEKAVKCRSCPRSFHKVCSEIGTVDGAEKDKTLCDFCLQNDVIRVNTPVLAKWQNKFYFGITRPWSSYPAAHRKHANYGELGYTVIEWPLERNQKSITPINNMVILTEQTIHMATGDVDEAAWRSALETFKKREEFPPILKNVNKNAQFSTFYGLVSSNRLYQAHEKQIVTCTCTGDNRCTDVSLCEAMNEGVECSENCLNCNNRGVTEMKLHPNMIRREAGIKGYGVYATGSIKKNEFLGEYAGEIIDKKEREKRTKIAKLSDDLEANHYMMDTLNGMTVDAARRGNITRYMNHSCDPNAESCRTRVLHKKGNSGGGKRSNAAFYEPRLYIRAKRDISLDEEITINYGMGSVSENFPRCTCGSANCSGKLAVVKTPTKPSNLKNKKLSNNKCKSPRASKPTCSKSDQKLEESENENEIVEVNTKRTRKRSNPTSNKDPKRKDEKNEEIVVSRSPQPSNKQDPKKEVQANIHRRRSPRIIMKEELKKEIEAKGNDVQKQRSPQSGSLKRTRSGRNQVNDENENSPDCQAPQPKMKRSERILSRANSVARGTAEAVTPRSERQRNSVPRRMFSPEE